MTLRSQLERFDHDTRLLVFTTLGQVYVGTLADIEDDAIRLSRPDALAGDAEIVLNLGDVSGVRPLTEEPEGPA